MYTFLHLTKGDNAMEIYELEKIAREVRRTILEEVHAAGSGHPGGSLSAADIMTALYFEVMNIDPADPGKEDRDKFVLSKGHAAPVLYAALAHRGFFPVEDCLQLRKLGSRFQGHPNMHKVPGVEMSTGSLGQGFSVAVGMALAAKMDHPGSRVYALLGDGEIQEGIIWEAAMAAAHYHLSNMTAIVDWNGLQIDGKNDDVMTVRPIDEKFRAFGWNVLSCDGHDMAAILEAFREASACTDKPINILVERTTNGKLSVKIQKELSTIRTYTIKPGETVKVRF